MSEDFRIAYACPHITWEDRVELNVDRRGLIPSQPIASKGFVRVTANDIPIPEAGLNVPAQLLGSVSGPFNIIKNENFVTISNGLGTTSQIELPIGTRIRTEVVVNILLDAFQSSSVEIVPSNEKGYLLLTDIAQVGRSSRVQIRGKAAKALGFERQVGARGKDVYPPWRVEKYVPECPTDPLVSIPRFTRQVASNPIFKLSYTVQGGQCWRCRGTFVENDYRYDRAGEPIRIVNEDLLAQESQKIILTKLRSNPFHPWYGTRILDSIGMKLLGSTAVSFQQEVVTALGRHQELQRLKSARQTVSSKERLYNILNVSVTPSVSDPTILEANVVVQNASSDPINISIVFSVPGAVALRGTNGRSLGILGN